MISQSLSSFVGSTGLEGRPASFRGVGFYVSSTTDEYARRGAHHEFPGRDRGVWEDLGGADPVITIPAFVAGWSAAAVEAQKTALIAACRKIGAGRLVHPFFGAKDVVCTSCKVTHDSARLGYIALDLSFLDAATIPAGASAAMSADRVNAEAGELETSLVDQFASDFSVVGTASYVQAAARQAWAGVIDGLGAIVGALDFDASSSPLVKDALNFLGAGAEWLRSGFDLAAYGNQLLIGAPDRLFDDARGAALDFTGLARLIVPLGGAPSDLLNAAPAIPANLSTPSRQRIAANAAAIASLVTGVAQIETVRAAITADYPHKDAALAARESIVSDFELWGASAPDAQYQSISALARNAAALIADQSADLQRLATISAKTTQPALVLAYQQDGTIANAADFVARNKISNPGFVADGDYQVLR